MATVGLRLSSVCSDVLGLKLRERDCPELVSYIASLQSRINHKFYIYPRLINQCSSAATVTEPRVRELWL